MKTYFISDLHLCEESSDSTALFLRFIASLPADTEAVYVLGDLFETWIGDDDDSPYALRIINALRSVVDRGILLFFMRGNRDFLYGDAFAGKTQGLVLDDECVIYLHGQRVLLLHGDQLCTDDLPYQQFRHMVRSSRWRGEFLLKPLAERRAIAIEMRRKSREALQNKAEYIMDINEQALAAVAEKFQVETLIHGHTHRPAQHEHAFGARHLTRHVLGDWHDSAWILCADDGAWQRIEFR